MKICNLFGLVATAVLFAGCATKPSFEGKTDLCGMVVDENNQPVEDYIVYYKKKMIEKSAATNTSGLFVFHDVSSGDFSISGEKSGFIYISDKKNSFFDRTKFLCYQVFSLDAVLEEVNKLISQQRYEDGLELIQKVSYNNKSNEKYVIDCYTAFLKEKINSKKENENNEK